MTPKPNKRSSEISQLRRFGQSDKKAFLKKKDITNVKKILMAICPILDFIAGNWLSNRNQMRAKPQTSKTDKNFEPDKISSNQDPQLHPFLFATFPFPRMSLKITNY